MKSGLNAKKTLQLMETDGTEMAISHNEKILKICQHETGYLIISNKSIRLYGPDFKQLQSHQETILAADFSDGTLVLATASHLKTIKLQENTFTELKSIELPDSVS